LEYLLSFLEGMITFISPCLLPMLPIYLSYFAGQEEGDSGQRVTLRNASGFVLGFTILFVLLGAFAGKLGGLLQEYRTGVNLVSGLVLILFGLNFMGVLSIPFLNQNRQVGEQRAVSSFGAAVLFGLVFSISWTPCVGTFLGAALMLAAQGGDSLRGMLMLLSYSLGLGLPFLLSALLIHKLKTTFAFIKRHYRVINTLAGVLLVILGVLVAFNLLRYLTIL